MHRIRKIVIPGLLAGSLVGSVALFTQVTPAAAGAGASQEVKAVLDLATPHIPYYVQRCAYGATGCVKTPTDSVPVTTLELLFGYSYTPGQVNEAPDVTSWTGKLPSLPGNMNGCSGQIGVAALATGARFTGSASQLRLNGQEKSSPTPLASPVSTSLSGSSPSPTGVAESGVGDAFCIGGGA